MREKEIEKKLTQMVKQAGGICPKLVSPGFAGMRYRDPPLRSLGFPVYVLDDAEQIGGILDEIRTP